MSTRLPMKRIFSGLALLLVIAAPCQPADTQGNPWTNIDAQGEARIRVQISAAHEKTHLDRAVAAFTKVGKDLGVLN